MKQQKIHNKAVLQSSNASNAGTSNNKEHEVRSILASNLQWQKAEVDKFMRLMDKWQIDMPNGYERIRAVCVSMGYSAGYFHAAMQKLLNTAQNTAQNAANIVQKPRPSSKLRHYGYFAQEAATAATATTGTAKLNGAYLQAAPNKANASHALHEEKPSYIAGKTKLKKQPDTS